jgi:hypothetical protein
VTKLCTGDLQRLQAKQISEKPEAMKPGQAIWRGPWGQLEQNISVRALNLALILENSLG